MSNFKKNTPEEFDIPEEFDVPEDEEYDEYTEDSLFVRKIMPIITVVLAIAIVILIGIMAYNFFTSKSSKPSSSSQAQTTVTVAPTVVPTTAPTVAATTTPIPEVTTAPVEEDQPEFISVNESVTAKEYVNLRDNPSQEESTVITTLENGDIATRIGINDSTGWSQVEYNGQTLYCVSSYLTTDISYQNPSAVQELEQIKTQFVDCSDVVTAKEEVNLRTLPSVLDSDSIVIATLYNGETVTRTGINNDVGWSRVEYNGQTLYCISSYLTTP